VILEFPPIETADPDSGLLAYGGDLEAGSLELAYRNGIFPWPSNDREPILWFAPEPRAVLFFDKLHVPARLLRYLKTAEFEFRVNENFEEVIRACAASKTRKHERGTWITRKMVEAYCEFYEKGFAVSFETYNASGRLVGGMYGVLIGNYFAGENMFYNETNASKFALLKGLEYLQRLSLNWIDIQMLTPLLQRFGAEEIPRKEFMKKLREAQSVTSLESVKKSL